MNLKLEIDMKKALMIIALVAFVGSASVIATTAYSETKQANLVQEDPPKDKKDSCCKKEKTCDKKDKKECKKDKEKCDKDK